MAKADADAIVTLPVLDRLIDREPNLAADPFITRAQSVRQLKASLRRDLEFLLNTRRTPEPATDAFKELKKSLFNYGLPDFTSVSLNSPKDKNSLLRAMEETIATFEPRLASVRVSLIEDPNPMNRILRFQIEALLLMDPAPEQISFDTTLNLTSGGYEIKGDRGA